MKARKLFLSLAVTALALAACNDEQEKTIAVTGVTLSQNTTLTVGNSLTLTANVQPSNATNKNVSWSSSNPAVATVADGKVTAKAVGATTITVTTEDGGKTASCTVTVKPFVPVAGVTLSLTSDTLAVGHRWQLTASVQPDSATNKAVTWASNNTVVATVSGGMVTAKAKGSATITVTTQDGGKIASCAVTVIVPLSLGTVSFATDSIWEVGSQRWSDAVQATGCNKTAYDGGTSGNYNYNADCRSNPNHKGDLFSWYAVDAFKSQLCPDGWRVPTKQDFIALDSALGGPRSDRHYSSTTLRDMYLDTWGGVVGGYCSPDGTLYHQTSTAEYWSQTERTSSATAHYLYFSAGGLIHPQDYGSKGYGRSLRCVK